MALFPRFRSPDRDRRTDAARSEAVLRELRAAIDAIEREEAGVARRCQEAAARTGGLMGNEDGIFAPREPEDEKQLVEAEAQMMNGYKRLADLRRQHARYSDLLARFLRDEAAAAAPDAAAPAEPPRSP